MPVVSPRLNGRVSSVYPPPPYYSDEVSTLYLGDCTKILPTIPSRGGVTPFNMLPIGSISETESNGHPAQTPLPLCTWWVKYLTPPGGIVLDMFAGSGSVGRASIDYGCRFIGIERDEGYIGIARKRLIDPEDHVGVTPERLV